MFNPTQERYVDPFSDIYSDKVNKRLKILFENGKSIVRGLHLSIDSSDLSFIHISAGDIVKDYVYIRFPQNMQINVSDLDDGTYAVVIHYNYQKIQPPPLASIGAVLFSEINPDDIILGTFRVSGGQCVEGSIDESDRTENELVKIISESIIYHGLTGDLDMQNYRIINLATDPQLITDPYDAVNKAYIDMNVTDNKVKVDDADLTSSYLKNKLKYGNNINITAMDADVTDPDNFTLTDNKDHVLYISGNDDMIRINSGDSSESII